MVPRERVASVIAAYVAAHPYEEPAFDVYPVENRRPRAGLGRVGVLDGRITVQELAVRLVDKLKVPEPAVAGRLDQPVGRVAVLPGSGRSLLAEAAKVADVFITGDLSYHDAETASELGIALVSVGHGDLEWAAMKVWIPRLREVLEPHGVEVETSRAWRPAWRSGGSHEGGVSGLAVARARSTRRADMPSEERPSKRMTVWIDGGSRGNPGPSAIGVVLRGEGGELVEEVGRTIGVATNNVAEYRALLEGLDMASRHGARRIEIFSDSELLVKQMRGEYRVKNEGLRGLFAEAKLRLEGFDQATIRHVPREENALADALVNQALDDAAGASETAKPGSGPKGETAPGLF